jgi:hypothetical protein
MKGKLMGDRSSIIISSKRFDVPITLYGHWSGEDNLTAVQTVIERTDRVGDPMYLTAQIFHEFSQLGNYDGNLSFGIGAFTNTSDNSDDNPAVYVDADTGEITHSPRE